MATLTASSPGTRRTAACSTAVVAQPTGLGGIAFTEHAELTEWVLPAGAAIIPGWERYLADRTLKLPPLDVERYLRSVEECRRLHPGLRILSGVEISEPHWHPCEVADLLARGHFDRVLGSVHAGRVHGGACEISALSEQWPAAMSYAATSPRSRT